MGYCVPMLRHDLVKEIANSFDKADEIRLGFKVLIRYHLFLMLG